MRIYIFQNIDRWEFIYSKILRLTGPCIIAPYSLQISISLQKHYNLKVMCNEWSIQKTAISFWCQWYTYIIPTKCNLAIRLMFTYKIDLQNADLCKNHVNVAIKKNLLWEGGVGGNVKRLQSFFISYVFFEVFQNDPGPQNML